MSLTKVTYSMINGAPVNVLDFMTATEIAAVQAGTYDSGVATAITTALATGKSLVFPEGSYLVSSALTCTGQSNFTIDMQGILVPYTLTNPGVWEVTDATSPEGVLNFSGCSNFTIIPNIIQTDVTKFGNGNVIYLTNCQNWEILDGTIDVACDASVTGGKAAVRVGATCQAFIISNNFIRGWYGALIGGSVVYAWTGIYNGVISDNIFVGQNSDGGIGVSIDAALAAVDRVSVHGNNVSDYPSTGPGGMGIAFARCTNSSIFGNTTINCKEGIHIEDGCSNVGVYGNACIDSDLYGIAVTSNTATGMAAIAISNNIITMLLVSGVAASARGILFNGGATSLLANSYVKDNLITNAGAALGFGIGASLTSRCEISGNRILGSWADGIYYAQTSANSGVGSVKLTDNRVAGSFSDAGIFVSDGSLAVASLSGNIIENTGAGVPYSLGSDFPCPGHTWQNTTSYLSTTTGALASLVSTTIFAKTINKRSLIEIHVSGTVQTTARDTRFSVILGGTTLYDSGLVTWGSTGIFDLILRVDCRDNTTQRTSVFGSYNNVIVALATVASSLNFATTNQLVDFQGAVAVGGAATDLTLYQCYVKIVE